jgi:hypothetical protein
LLILKTLNLFGFVLLSVPDEGYPRNTSCALKWGCTFDNLTNESKKKRRINYLYVQLQTTRSKNKEDNDIFRRNWKSEVWIDLDRQNHITSLKYVEDNKLSMHFLTVFCTYLISD